MELYNNLPFEHICLEKYKITNIISTKLEVTHDGYDEYGPESNLYDYYVLFIHNNNIYYVAKVAAIHYDPHRNARLALLFYEDGEKRYIIAPAGVKVGQNVISGESVPIEDGNAMPLSVMPLGSSVHCVELYAGRGAQMVRSAGASAQVMAKEGDYVALKLPSTEVRLVRKEC